jgi:osmoprotectant transport system ATP-binding protein
VRPAQGLAEAIGIMRRRRVNGLVVVSREGLYLGVLGQHEILGRYLDEHAIVDDVMYRDAPMVSADMEASAVVSLIEQDARGFLPVCDARGKLLGVITRSTLIQVLVPAYRKEEEKHEPVADFVAKLE